MSTRCRQEGLGGLSAPQQSTGTSAWSPPPPLSANPRGLDGSVTRNRVKEGSQARGRPGRAESPGTLAGRGTLAAAGRVSAGPRTDGAQHVENAQDAGV